MTPQTTLARAFAFSIAVLLAATALALAPNAPAFSQLTERPDCPEGFQFDEFSSGCVLVGEPEPLPPFIGEEGTGEPATGPGASEGEPPGPGLPPAVLAFIAACQAQGGEVFGEGGVMERLPETPDGYTCWYPNPNPQSNDDEGRSCFQLLQNSGAVFQGGNPGCPEVGLLPPGAPAAEPEPAAEPIPEAPLRPTATPVPTATPIPTPRFRGEWAGTFSGPVTVFAGCQTTWSGTITLKLQQEVDGGPVSGSLVKVGAIAAKRCGNSEYVPDPPARYEVPIPRTTPSGNTLSFPFTRFTGLTETATMTLASVTSATGRIVGRAGDASWDLPFTVSRR